MDWIFQGNPDYFDIDRYFEDFEVINWSVKQKHHAPEMGVGDRVFFWRSSGKKKGVAGIIALGEILEEPKVFAEDAEALKYWKVGGGEIPELRVVLKVTHCLPANSINSKASIEVNQKLRDLQIISQPRMTNYKITDDEFLSLYNGFMIAYEQSVPGVLTSYSWTIENQLSAQKILDKSAFLHHGTGVPIGIRSYFIDGYMEPGKSRQVNFSYDGEEYSAHIDLDNQPTPRTRLFWNSDFSSLLKRTFPHHYAKYSQDEEPESKIILKLTKLSGFDKYEVLFADEVTETTAHSDVEADEIEDRGPQTEGGATYYYGKRYERSPKNRKEAIRIHGISCNACGFNFEKAYGERGSSYIEVHHIKPIHTYEDKQPVDPRTDLITVCSNCHRMIHRKPNDILSVEDVKAVFQKMETGA